MKTIVIELMTIDLLDMVLTDIGCCRLRSVDKPIIDFWKDKIIGYFIFFIIIHQIKAVIILGEDSLKFWIHCIFMLLFYVFFLNFLFIFSWMTLWHLYLYIFHIDVLSFIFSMSCHCRCTLLNNDCFCRIRYREDVAVEDCDERARIERAREIAEGMEPPPGYAFILGLFIIMIINNNLLVYLLVCITIKKKKSINLIFFLMVMHALKL